MKIIIRAAQAYTPHAMSTRPTSAPCARTLRAERRRADRVGAEGVVAGWSRSSTAGGGLMPFLWCILSMVPAYAVGANIGDGSGGKGSRFRGE